MFITYTVGDVGTHVAVNFLVVVAQSETPSTT